jgi:hypothetical protein
MVPVEQAPWQQQQQLLLAAEGWCLDAWLIRPAAAANGYVKVT